MKKSNRKLKNLLISPGFQLRLCLTYALSGLTFLGGVVGFALFRLKEVNELMNQGAEMNFAVQMQVNEKMLEILQITLAGFVLYIVFNSVFALLQSHRIAGPVVAITAYIEELKAGNYDYQRRLRPKDDLKEIMTGLHELTPILRERDKG